MQVFVPPGVFHPRSDTWMLRDAVVEEVEPGARFLELCAGPSAVAVAAAEAGALATAVELSRWSALAARANALRAGVRVRVRRGDLYQPLRGERFDVIASNPPYVPQAPDDRAPRGTARAWAGGPDGRVLVDRIIAGLPDHLAPGGRVLLVHSSITGDSETVDALRRVGLLEVDVVARERGPLGPLVRRQQAAGAIDPALDHEDLVVIRGVAPGG